MTGAQNFVDTPMSVDSDTISEDIQVPVIVIDDVPQDVNANPIVGDDGKLKLDTTTAREKFNESRFGVPDTAVLAQITPESGLISAGVQAKQGFEFPMVRDSCSELEMGSEASYEADEIYREFVEAMEKQNLNLCELPNMTGGDCGSVTDGLETIEQYTNIFKYLVKVRWVSFVLGKSFQLLKEAHKQCGKQMLLSPQYSRVQLISHKLSHLVNALKNYITSSALQASWETFRKDLESAESMEDIYRKHTSYIKKILFLCLLNKKSVEFYNNVEEIFKVVLRFYKHLKAKPWKPQDKTNPSSPYVHPKYAQILDDESDFEKLIKYTIYLGNKMYDHGYQKEIYEFISVININGYYGPIDGQ